MPPTLTTIIQHNFGSFKLDIRQEKEMKRTQNWKEESQIISADDMKQNST